MTGVLFFTHAALRKGGIVVHDRKQSAWFDARTIQMRLQPHTLPGPRARAKLAQAGGGPVPPTEAELETAYRKHVDQMHRNLIARCREAMRRRNVDSVNAILLAMRQLEGHADADERLIELAGRWIALILHEHELLAYRAFRQFPSKENYEKCWAARRNLDTMGLPEQRDYPVDPRSRCRIKPPLKAGPYRVERGDWLSKIAQRFYGEANLWDYIFETNGYDGDPDLIQPGTMLVIRNGL